MPSMFIIKNIKEAKINKMMIKFLIFSMLSIDNKNWKKGSSRTFTINIKWLHLIYNVMENNKGYYYLKF